MPSPLASPDPFYVPTPSSAMLPPLTPPRPYVRSLKSALAAAAPSMPLLIVLALLAAGLGRGTYSGGSFAEMTDSIEPFLLVFAGSGVCLMVGLWLILVPGAYLIGQLVFPRDKSVQAAEAS